MASWFLGRGAGVCVTSAVFACLVACGGSGSPVSTPTTPTAPATPAKPATPVTPTTTWSTSGQVVAAGTTQGIAGATLTPGWGLTAVTTDAQGNYQLGDIASPPSNPYPVTISAPGAITHDVWVNWASGARTGVTLDLIRDAAPFNMDFYRKFVRGTYDQRGAPWPVMRWTTQPSFYVKTTDQNGRAIEPEVMVRVLDAIRQAVPAFTAGHFSAATIETGTDSRPRVMGWINVNIRRDPNEHRTCGQSLVGANPGEITLNDDVCSCGSNKIPGAVTMHEVGHAMGFFHVDDRRSLMYPFISGDCPAGALSPAESYHAAIAYSRPRGNTDPDHDPTSGSAMTASTAILVAR